MKKNYLIILMVVIVINLHSQMTYTVKQDGSGSFTTIQTAINYVSDGDSIIVYPGFYLENLIIREKSLFLGSLY